MGTIKLSVILLDNGRISCRKIKLGCQNDRRKLKNAEILTQMCWKSETYMHQTTSGFEVNFICSGDRVHHVSFS